MPAGNFAEYSPQEQIAAARAMLQQNGAPITADNLNRAMQALLSGQPMDTSNIERAAEAATRERRAVEPRGTRPAARPAPQPAAAPEPRMQPVPEPPAMREPTPEPAPAATASAAPTRPDADGQQEPGVLRRGGARSNGARRIDDSGEGDNAGNDMFTGTLPRSATGTPESTSALAEAIVQDILPLAIAGGAGVAARGAVPGLRGQMLGDRAARTMGPAAGPRTRFDTAADKGRSLQESIAARRRANTGGRQ